MMRKVVCIILSAVLVACQAATAPETAANGMNKFIVLEVIHTTNYTYLRAGEEKGEKWLAIPLTDARKGETYYYGAAMEMKNFQSKELGRVFETVYFLEGISESPEALTAVNPLHNHANEEEHNHDYAEDANTKTGAGAQPKKQPIKLSLKDGISIAKLFSEKKSFEGKTVSIKGQVVKFSSGIMDRNWLHIQDGSEHEGKFDLTVTSTQAVNIGDTIICEGKIALNKDIGHGYFFEVMMEDAVIRR